MDIQIDMVAMRRLEYESNYNPKSPDAKEIQVGPYTILTSFPGMGVEKNCWEQVMAGKEPPPLKRYSNNGETVRVNGTYIKIEDMFNGVIPGLFDQIRK